MASTSSREIARQIALQCRHAVETGAPLLLLVCYQDEAEKSEVLAELYRELRDQGVPYEQLDPAHRPDQGTGRLYDSIAASSQSGVAIVPAMPRRQDAPGLDPAFLEYMNLHRDRIARDHLRFVLFLHAAEAEQFIREAGDLWDFRHHTYWLERSPQPRGEALWADLDRGSVELSLADSDRQDLLTHVTQVRALVEETPGAEEKAALLLDLSRWLVRRNAFTQAAEVGMEGLAQCPEERLALRSALESAVGMAFLGAARLPEALPHFEFSLTLGKACGDRRTVVRSMDGIAKIYLTWGRYDDALAYLGAALQGAREAGDRSSEAGILDTLGKTYRDRGRYHEALGFFEQALDLASSDSDRANEARVLAHIGAAQRELTDYGAALESLHRSVALSAELSDRDAEGVALGSLAILYSKLGREEEALKSHEKALAIFREVGNKFDEAATLNNIGGLYLRSGRNEGSLTFVKSALEASRAVGDRRGEAIALRNLARAYWSLDRRDEATRLGELGLAIFREIGDSRGEAWLAQYLARQLAQENPEKALLLARRAVELDHALDSPNLKDDQNLVRNLERQQASPKRKRKPRHLSGRSLSR